MELELINLELELNWNWIGIELELNWNWIGIDKFDVELELT